jgi:Ni/Fe-hydrogenase subunit HybB-like protein
MESVQFARINLVIVIVIKTLYLLIMLLNYKQWQAEVVKWVVARRLREKIMKMIMIINLTPNILLRNPPH